MRKALLAFAVVLAACTAGRSTGPQPFSPDYILYNGKIVTVDGAFTIARAIAVHGDQVFMVGTDADVRAYAGPKTRQIDLRGATVIPGLIDGHLHNAGGGPGVDLSKVRTIDELLAAVATRARSAGPGDIIVSNSDWHEAQLREKRLPHRRELDRAAPDHPVVLVRGGHQFILNSAALARWDISKATVSPPGGEIGHDADGELNGELVDTARGLVKLPPPPKLTVEDIAAQMRLLNSVGLTSIRIPGSFQFGGDILTPYRMFQELKAKGELTMRVNYLMRIADYSSVEKVRATIESWNVKPDEGDEWLRIGGMKTMVDGGFEGGHMREPYAEPYGKGGKYKGIQVVPTANYTAVVRELNRMGWRVAAHAVGDAAIDQVLDAYAAANRERSIRPWRWTIEHFFIGREDHYPRLRDMQLIVSAQDHLYLAAPSMAKYWGRSRAERVTPVRTLMGEGILVAGGTDSPVIPYNPFWAMYHFVTRETISDGVYGAAERIPREDALRMYTINNARLTFEEARKGSLAHGKYADLVVLSADYLTVPESAIPSIKPLATMVGGKFVYTDPGWRQ